MVKENNAQKTLQERTTQRMNKPIARRKGTSTTEKMKENNGEEYDEQEENEETIRDTTQGRQGVLI